jgi:hypothetical protein
MSIEVRDDGGPVMQLRFTFNIIKEREKHRQEPREWDGLSTKQCMRLLLRFSNHILQSLQQQQHECACFFLGIGIWELCSVSSW